MNALSLTRLSRAFAPAIVAILLAIPSFPAVAAERSWPELLADAAQNRRPMFVVFRPEECKERPDREFCRQATEIAAYPALQRRLGAFTSGVLPLDDAPPALAYGASVPGLALFDPAGRLVAKWGALPDPLAFALILDDVTLATPDIVAASEAAARDDDGAYDLGIGIARLKIGCAEEARSSLESARAAGSGDDPAFASIHLAILDARHGKYPDAIRQLQPFASEPYSKSVRIEALLALGDLRKHAGYPERAADAYRRTIALAAEGSPQHASALASLKELEPRLATGVVQIFPPGNIVSGQVTVVARAGSTEVRRVDFALDGTPVASIRTPPFAARIPFKPLPEPQVVSVTAYRADGTVAGRDELAVNQSAEAFWVRIVEPSAARASGRTPVTLSVHKPEAQDLHDVTLEWNGRQVARFAKPPFAATVDIPGGEIGVLTAKATLRDGTVAVDERVMNVEGMVEEAGVHLVELPVIFERGDVSASQLTVREDGAERPVERILRPDDTPLILGVVIDSSSSMRPSIIDLQEAAVQFVESVMRPRDRSFVVSFNTEARLIQTPTQDVDAVKASIMGIRPEGHTALHDAFILGLMQFQTTGSRRAMIVFTDGVNRSSRYTMDEVNETARRAGVPVYVIAMVPPELRDMPPMAPAGELRTIVAGRVWSSEFDAAVFELSALARMTGGSFEEIRSIENVGRIYREIGAELQRQSLVIYRSQPDAHGAWHTLDVRAKGRGRVRAPAGVYVKTD